MHKQIGKQARQAQAKKPCEQKAKMKAGVLHLQQNRHYRNHTSNHDAGLTGTGEKERSQRTAKKTKDKAKTELPPSLLNQKTRKTEENMRMRAMSCKI